MSRFHKGRTAKFNNNFHFLNLCKCDCFGTSSFQNTLRHCVLLVHRSTRSPALLIQSHCTCSAVPVAGRWPRGLQEPGVEVGLRPVPTTRRLCYLFLTVRSGAVVRAVIRAFCALAHLTHFHLSAERRGGTERLSLCPRSPRDWGQSLTRALRALHTRFHSLITNGSVSQFTGQLPKWGWARTLSLCSGCDSADIFVSCLHVQPKGKA